MAPRALPARFRRPRLLIVGCGDVGLRVVRQLGGRLQLRALTSQPGRADELRALGITPLIGNLDQPSSLRRLAGLAQHVLHLAPPPGQGATDPRTRALLAALSARPLPWAATPAPAITYASTSGVYGDAQGARFDETRPVRPANPRALRRVDAEQQLRCWALRRGGGHVGVGSGGGRITILRIPGIYALDRAGGDPRDRLRRGAPVLRSEDDVYTNHIHADDLARACIAALWRGRPQRVVHTCDHSELRMGDYFDLVADLHGFARPARISFEQAQRELGPMQLSFMSESRRLDNHRLVAELRVALRYADVRDGLVAGLPAHPARTTG
jgi:nucleoside-diphosphate-sugar epimerase